jgi:hypothetical protein
MDFIDFDEPRLSFGAALKQNVRNQYYNIKSFLTNIFIEQN